MKDGGIVKLDVYGVLPLQKQLGLLRMSPLRRKRYLNKVMKRIMRDAKMRVRKQVDLQGRPYVKRSKKRSKNHRKMLSRMVRQLKVTQLTGDYGVAGFYNAKVGKIAAGHQYGKITIVESSRMQTRRQEQYDWPATRKQAKALLDLDFKIKRASGKGLKKPSIKYIVEAFTQGKAGAIIKYMRVRAGETIKKRWTTVLPARSFLGATPYEIRHYIDQFFFDMDKELLYVHQGWLPPLD